MREILFRGKMDDNSRWVEGYYCRAFRWTGDKEPVPAIQEADCFMFRAIDPSTVGQYTGLKDRNGKRIFEGDIIQRLCDVYDLGKRYPVGQRMVIGVVTWDSESGTELGCWCIDTTDRHGNQIKIIFDSNYEIIGNIHDNPKLLKGE